MTQITPALSLPYIQPAQAQKHVTHNDALRVLDALVQLSVIEEPLAEPPANPDQGARYIVAPGATGVWDGQDGAIALFGPSGWEFHAAQPGWRADVQSSGEVYRFDGATWARVATESTDKLGVNTAADETNRLAVSASATLLTHSGTDHQLKINKASGGDTASLLFQTNWSGRAEMGTSGTDDFAIKVSADGATWNEGLSIGASDGAVTTGADLTVAGIARLLPIALADLPAAAPAGSLAFCPDTGAGAQLLFSDGSDWRGVGTGALV
ncbi:DUF2793 domain-containing protein [Poseidonocella sedimentorum]|uniref:Uncharacterized protein n=1 Tax=Poseidonocella sedimentorum TaxID=871652 RepID=A0A1I6D953_9RHOB|nr:DUF2793 domain-containing protein [Poseidonocella sedimentorum]SFR01979.1 Protein of unknown function [Poseidonocella sedimentorum]